MGAAGGAGLPPVYTILLERFGAKVTLVGIGLVTMAATAVALCFVQPRTPELKGASAPKMKLEDLKFFRQPIFILFLAAVVVQSLGHFSPSVYLPSIGRDMGLTPTEGALLISMLNLAQAIGQPSIGFLT